MLDNPYHNWTHIFDVTQVPASQPPAVRLASRVGYRNHARGVAAASRAPCVVPPPLSWPVQLHLGIIVATRASSPRTCPVVVVELGAAACATSSAATAV